VKALKFAGPSDADPANFVGRDLDLNEHLICSHRICTATTHKVCQQYAVMLRSPLMRCSLHALQAKTMQCIIINAGANTAFRHVLVEMVQGLAVIKP